MENKNEKHEKILNNTPRSQPGMTANTKNISQNTVYSLVLTALFASLIFVATAFFPKIPLALGYVHVGDTFILLAATFLSPVYAALAAAIGSGLADLTSGYLVWIPATVIIKAMSAWLMSSYSVKVGKKHRTKKSLRNLILSCVCGLIVAIGYLIYEVMLFGFGAAIASFPFNILQGAVSTVLFYLISTVIEKLHAKFRS